MFVARAPGKLVISGAYSVLWGAPALVAAVSRYAVADAERPAVHESAEVQAAIELGFADRHVFVDVSDLRAKTPDGASRKLGLGSSAAILLASLLAQHGEPRDEAERRALFLRALAAHRRAQGGGSGIDVAASTFGGVLCFRMPQTGEELPDVRHATLPAGLLIRVFESPVAASTADFVRRVRAFAKDEQLGFGEILQQATRGAEQACAATEPASFIDALSLQAAALARLGSGARIPIVTTEVAEVAELARLEQAAFLPSGAGGGDIALFVGQHEPSDSLVAAARRGGLTPIDLTLGAPGAVRLNNGPA